MCELTLDPSITHTNPIEINMPDEIECWLCGKKAELVPPKEDPDFPWPGCWTSPKGWVRSRNLDGRKVDFCSKFHSDLYQEAIAIGPPATRLLYRAINGDPDGTH